MPFRTALGSCVGLYRISLPDHIRIAKELGYAGIEIRYSLLPAQNEIARVRMQLQANGVTPVFCFCSKVPDDGPSWDGALRVMQTLRELGGALVRVAPMKEDDLPAVRELACRAKEMGVRVLLHVHIHTFCDTPSKTLSALERIDHPAMRVLLDPTHLAMSEETDMARAIQRLLPWTAIANIQNYRRTGPTEPPGEIAGYDGNWSRLGPGLPGGIDFQNVLGELRQSGYAGWLNVMCATSPEDDPIEIAQRYFDILNAAI